MAFSFGSEGLAGVQEPRCKRWGNVSEKFPLCPSFAWSSFYLELYNRNYSEKRPNWGGKKKPQQKSSFVKLSRVDISVKLIVFLPNHAGPWSPTSNQHKGWDDKPISQKFLGSRLLLRWNCLKYKFPSVVIVHHGLMFYSLSTRGAKLEICAKFLSSIFWGHHAAPRDVESCILPLPWRSSSSFYCTLYKSNHFSITQRFSYFCSKYYFISTQSVR